MKYAASQEDSLQKQTKRKGWKTNLVFLQDTALTMPMALCSFIYIFFSATSPARQSNQKSQGLMGELMGMYFKLPVQIPFAKTRQSCLKMPSL